MTTTVKPAAPCPACAPAIAAVAAHAFPLALARGEDPASHAGAWLSLDRYGANGRLRHLAGLTAEWSNLDPADMASLIATLAEGAPEVPRIQRDIAAIRTALGAGGPGRIQIRDAAAPCCLFTITAAHRDYWGDVARTLEARRTHEILRRGRKPGLKLQPRPPSD